MFSSILLSDHRVLGFSFEIKSHTAYGSSYWKCNVSILRDPLVKKEMQDLFAVAKQYPITPSWWETCKCKIKNILIQMSKKLASGDRQIILFLEKQIHEFKKAQQYIPGAYHIEIDSLQVERDSLLGSVSGK